MAISCGAKCAKVLLVIFNIIFWLSGAVLLAAGIYILLESDRSKLYQLLPPAIEGSSYALHQYLAYALIGIGGLIFIIGFLGCCGAIRESRCMLATYFIFLFIILASELAVGILAVVFQDKILSEMKTDMKEKLQHQYGSSSALTAAFDLAQVRLKCCGVEGPSDYAQSKWKTDDMAKDLEISKTCCVLQNEEEEESYLHPIPLNNTVCQDMKDPEGRQFRHNKGCLEALQEFIKMDSHIIIGLGCGLAALELIGMISAICLCKEI